MGLMSTTAIKYPAYSALRRRHGRRCRRRRRLRIRRRHSLRRRVPMRFLPIRAFRWHRLRRCWRGWHTFLLQVARLFHWFFLRRLDRLYMMQRRWWLATGEDDVARQLARFQCRLEEVAHQQHGVVAALAPVI